MLTKILKKVGYYFLEVVATTLLTFLLILLTKYIGYEIVVLITLAFIIVKRNK